MLQVGVLRGRERQHIDDDGRAIVRVRCNRGFIDQLARGFLRRGAFAQRGVDPLLRKRPMYAVTAQQVAVMDARGVGDVIGAQDVLRTDGARQRMAGTGRAQRVVAGQLGEFVVAQSVGAGIPHVHHMGATAGEYQRT